MGQGQSSEFPYTVGAEVPLRSKYWKMHLGTSTDGQAVSIFSFNKEQHKEYLELAKNAHKRFKTLRHPYMLKYLGGTELEKTIYIVTEEVKPLRDCLDYCKEYPQSIAWGLFTTASALEFLAKCNFVFGSLNIDAVFVKKDGDWKLGGMEFVSDRNADASPLKTFVNEIPERFLPPELKKRSWEAVAKAPAHAVDAWSLGCFVYEIFDGSFSQQQELQKPSEIPKELLPAYRNLLQSLPRKRVSFKQFLTSPFFNADYVNTALFLENITIKEAADKEAFFKKLDPMLDAFPVEACKFKILPALVSALDFGSANSRVLAPLLKIGTKLNEEEYAAHVTPSVVRWFANPDRTLRINLLQNIPAFAVHLSKQLVDTQILPHVVMGFGDPHPMLRELTVKAMIHLVPKMSESNVTSQVLPNMAKLQQDREPGIRTNTTICLGKISPHLPPAARKQSLIPAFSRAMRDPFPPARIAGIMSFSATQNFHEPDDMAKKILPPLCMLCVDPVRYAKL
eukprot:TRINITY_DN7548_c0_g1_i2.p1 TRINITY_DN7548_c0_g1~~TRINITY_DN7548_c0_g1_i2.p1  ORF type:complete len:509 (+),score=105.95 TRINITY_DN7548_c0_g1_i2:215-1741(+)